MDEHYGLHRSLAETAERDLEAALQLLAERARYVTGASGSAIALLNGKQMVVRASAGSSALEVSAELHGSFSEESIRAGEIFRCDDVEQDHRLGRDRWRVLRIKTLLVAPLLHEQQVIGALELWADRTSAFDDGDVATLQRLSEMVLTAVEHFQAAQRAEVQIRDAGADPTQASPAVEASAASAPVDGSPAVVVHQMMAPPRESANIRTCQACGFPVSADRTLCLDCEEAGMDPGRDAPAFLSHLAANQNQNWLQSHLYTVGTVLVAALTVVLLVLKFR